LRTPVRALPCACAKSELNVIAASAAIKAPIAFRRI
jgi:hypothetical protein